jgi:DNA-dependent RNA polymerase auxiliary subunit epsilon
MAYIQLSDNMLAAQNLLVDASKSRRMVMNEKNFHFEFVNRW